MPYLTLDVVGTSSRITYGKKGDVVEVYSKHDNVFIVENENKLRFSVLKDQLSNKKIEPDLQVINRKK